MFIKNAQIVRDAHKVSAITSFLHQLAASFIPDRSLFQATLLSFGISNEDAGAHLASSVPGNLKMSECIPVVLHNPKSTMQIR